MRVHPINTFYKRQNIFSPCNNQTNCYGAMYQFSLTHNYLNLISNYNISFLGQNKPFYAIDSEGNCTKYNTRKDAEINLSLAKSNIAECLQGKRLTSHGYSFVYANEIETKNEFGETVIDEEKFKSKISELKIALEAQDKPKPIYAISENGTYKKYSSKYQASKELGINSPRIIKCLNGTIRKTGGYTFVTPDTIEKETSSGGIVVDKDKLAEILYNDFEASNSTPVYAIDENGFTRKFSGVRKAARELSLEAANISRCLNGSQKRVGEYTFVRAKEIEIESDNGNVQINRNKVNEINNASFEHESYVPVYAIDADGNYTKYPNKKRAAAALGIENSALSHCLLGRYNVVNNYAFILAADVEEIDTNGEVSINFDLIKEKYEQANKNSVYVINKDGTFKKYLTQTEAAKDLGLRRTKISACINGESNKVGERTFVKASDVESFDNGKVVINRALLKKFASELLSTGVKAVYSFDSKGNYQRHNSVKDLTKSLSVGETGVRECLKGKKLQSCGYRFLYADNFEKINENGQLIIDYEKLDNFLIQTYPSIKRYLSRYGKIYALKGVDVQEFKNIRIAARELGIDEKSIIYFLRTGRNFSDGKKTINGFVLTCENDK